jgi:hypothetical protein
MIIVMVLLMDILNLQLVVLVNVLVMQELRLVQQVHGVEIHVILLQDLAQRFVKVH